MYQLSETVTQVLLEAENLRISFNIMIYLTRLFSNMLTMVLFDNPVATFLYMVDDTNDV